VAYAHKPSPQEAALAIKACQAVHADFAGVDILIGNEGPLICEINSNAHFLGLREATGINPAQHILRLIQKEI